MLKKPEIITQHFGNNKNALFYGSAGHTGLDYFIKGGVGAYIESLSDGEVIGFYKGNDPRVDYYEIRVKWNHNGKIYRLGYGHVASWCVEKGDKIKVGQIIGMQGNGGNVASNGIPVTREDRLNGDKRGAHVHFSVKEIDKNGAVIIPDGATRGNLNPYLFMTDDAPVEIVKDLILKKGDNGDEVRVLQALLKGHGAPIVIDGDFGPKTESYVKGFQKNNNLIQDGVVGPVTWAALRQL